MDEWIDVAYAVLLLLHVQLGAIVECPVNEIRLVTSALDELTRLQSGPEAAEVLH